MSIWELIKGGLKEVYEQDKKEFIKNFIVPIIIFDVLFLIWS